MAYGCSSGDQGGATGPSNEAVRRLRGDAGDPQINFDPDASNTLPPPGPVVPPPRPEYGSTVSQADPPPPIFGGTLAISKDNQYAIAADPDRGQVYLAPLYGWGTLTVDTGWHTLPFRVAEDASRRAHVTLRGTGELATIDIDTGTLLFRREVCPEPRGLAYEPATDLVHVACDGGQLSRSLPPVAIQCGRSRSLAACVTS